MPMAERTPLLPTTKGRSVTFNPHTSISGLGTVEEPPAPARLSSAQPPARLSTLNNKLRRRNSHGTPLAPQSTPRPETKIGPQRTTKTAQKLKLLPNPDHGDDGPDEESGRDVYSQFTRIKDPTARRDAARLGKADRERLPRVTAYCTANGYRLEAMMRWLKSRKARQKGASPKQFDECIYSPYNYHMPRRNSSEALVMLSEAEASPMAPGLRERRFSDSAIDVDETASHGASPNDKKDPDFDTHVDTPEVFLFQYGTVVIWGMSLVEERSFLEEIARFETEKLSPADIETENFNFYYTREYQARIYNDFISLREKKNYMTKLAISHALAQSVKTSLFEELLSTTITATQPLPEQIALTGSIAMSRKEIHQQIGQLFILRINIHLQGSVLDSPELMWAEPALEPVYAAVRSYLEMDQRVGLLTERLSVIGDLLAVLKDQVGTKHGEYLEWIGKLATDLGASNMHTNDSHCAHCSRNRRGRDQHRGGPVRRRGLMSTSFLCQFTSSVE